MTDPLDELRDVQDRAEHLDRMLVAQTQALSIPIITVDGRLKAYDVELVDD